jgi:hypothetical protein
MDFTPHLKLVLVGNVNIVIVYGNLKSENSQDCGMPKNLNETVRYVHEFDFWIHLNMGFVVSCLSTCLLILYGLSHLEDCDAFPGFYVPQPGTKYNTSDNDFLP